MKKRVVIDTDPGVDDALALFLAYRSPELRIEAVTTVNGNVPIKQGTRNAALILDLLRPEPLPILAEGAAKPLDSKGITAQSVHGSDGLGELNRFKDSNGNPRYPEPQISSDLPSATEVLLELLKRYPDELSVIALGPLTNLGEAILANKGLVKRLREVIIMGGAIKVSGNITPAAEFNIFVDPRSAELVFNSGLNITLVPLDVTKRVCLGSLEIEHLAQAMPKPLGMFLSDTTSKALEYMKHTHGMEAIHLHDPLAVGAAIAPDMVETTPLHVNVETEGKVTQGMTLADLRPIRDDLKQPPNLKVALEVDANRFMSFFKERLCRKSS
jgi:purine nucleosidase/pyrimidine-specific ribonucleoside hydrolase